MKDTRQNNKELKIRYIKDRQLDSIPYGQFKHNILYDLSVERFLRLYILHFITLAGFFILLNFESPTSSRAELYHWINANFTRLRPDDLESVATRFETTLENRLKYFYELADYIDSEHFVSTNYTKSKKQDIYIKKYNFIYSRVLNKLNNSMYLTIPERNVVTKVKEKANNSNKKNSITRGLKKPNTLKKISELKPKIDIEQIRTYLYTLLHPLNRDHQKTNIFLTIVRPLHKLLVSKDIGNLIEWFPVTNFELHTVKEDESMISSWKSLVSDIEFLNEKIYPVDNSKKILNKTRILKSYKKKKDHIFTKYTPLKDLLTNSITNNSINSMKTNEYDINQSTLQNYENSLITVSTNEISLRSGHIVAKPKINNLYSYRIFFFSRVSKVISIDQSVHMNDNKLHKLKSIKSNHYRKLQQSKSEKISKGYNKTSEQKYQPCDARIYNDINPTLTDIISTLSSCPKLLNSKLKIVFNRFGYSPLLSSIIFVSLEINYDYGVALELKPIIHTLPLVHTNIIWLLCVTVIIISTFMSNFILFSRDPYLGRKHTTLRIFSILLLVGLITEFTLSLTCALIADFQGYIINTTEDNFYKLLHKNLQSIQFEDFIISLQVVNALFLIIRTIMLLLCHPQDSYWYLLGSKALDDLTHFSSVSIVSLSSMGVLAYILYSSEIGMFSTLLKSTMAQAALLTGELPFTEFRNSHSPYQSLFFILFYMASLYVLLLNMFIALILGYFGAFRELIAKYSNLPYQRDPFQEIYVSFRMWYFSKRWPTRLEDFLQQMDDWCSLHEDRLSIKPALIAPLQSKGFAAVQFARRRRVLPTALRTKDWLNLTKKERLSKWKEYRFEYYKSFHISIPHAVNKYSNNSKKNKSRGMENTVDQNKYVKSRKGAICNLAQNNEYITGRKTSLRKDNISDSINVIPKNINNLNIEETNNRFKKNFQIRNKKNCAKSLYIIEEATKRKQFCQCWDSVIFKAEQASKHVAIIQAVVAPKLINPSKDVFKNICLKNIWKQLRIDKLFLMNNINEEYIKQKSLYIRPPRVSFADEDKTINNDQTSQYSYQKECRFKKKFNSKKKKFNVFGKNNNDWNSSEVSSFCSTFRHSSTLTDNISGPLSPLYDFSDSTQLKFASFVDIYLSTCTRFHGSVSLFLHCSEKDQKLIQFKIIDPPLARFSSSLKTCPFEGVSMRSQYSYCSFQTYLKYYFDDLSPILNQYKWQEKKKHSQNILLRVLHFIRKVIVYPITLFFILLHKVQNIFKISSKSSNKNKKESLKKNHVSYTSNSSSSSETIDQKCSFLMASSPKTVNIKSNETYLLNSNKSVLENTLLKLDKTFIDIGQRDKYNYNKTLTNNITDTSNKDLVFKNKTAVEKPESLTNESRILTDDLSIDLGYEQYNISNEDSKYSDTGSNTSETDISHNKINTSQNSIVVIIEDLWYFFQYYRYTAYKVQLKNIHYISLPENDTSLLDICRSVEKILQEDVLTVLSDIQTHLLGYSFK